MECSSDEEFFDMFLNLLSDHPYPKYIACVDSNGQGLSQVKSAWAATIAEEQGFLPLLAYPAIHVTYYITVAPQTGLTGYVSFEPIWC